MATGGHFCWPPVGSSDWPLTILDGCREIVKASDLSEFPREVSFKVLNETGRRLRNVLTHDRWIHAPGKKQETWHSPRVETVTKPLSTGRLGVLTTS